MSASVPTKRSVALVIRNASDPSLVLAVLRPADDEDLPNVWGLPAASLREGETWEEAVRRAAKGKLGVEVTPGRLLKEGSKERARHRLEMRLYDATLGGSRQPAALEASPDVTRYTAWKWAAAEALAPAAAAGSLCARLFLESEKSRA